MTAIPSGRARARLHDAVLGWYAERGRRLAFRDTSDPWAILVSEVMAQQTQATRAAEAWTGFMAAFPTPAALAVASPATVLRAWRGLGYNRRAVALREAARRIVDVHDGQVPGDVEALRRLPGVGPYTARAVAALAFGARVGPVDTNVRRVLTRAFFEVPPGARELQDLADAVVPSAAAGTWTHALMDIGAWLCRPRAPRCDACPLAATCRLAARGAPDPERHGSARAAAFPSTRRWLRGRILDRLRDAPDDDWVELHVPIGQHGREAILAEVARMAGEGLLEQPAGGGTWARLPA